MLKPAYFRVAASAIKPTFLPGGVRTCTTTNETILQSRVVFPCFNCVHSWWRLAGKAQVHRHAICLYTHFLSDLLMVSHPSHIIANRYLPDALVGLGGFDAGMSLSVTRRPGLDYWNHMRHHFYMRFGWYSVHVNMILASIWPPSCVIGWSRDHDGGLLKWSKPWHFDFAAQASSPCSSSTGSVAKDFSLRLEVFYELVEPYYVHLEWEYELFLIVLFSIHIATCHNFLS